MRIVVTGMGAVTPVGVGGEAYWDGLLSGRCGIGEISRLDTAGFPVTRAAEVRGFSAREHLPAKLAADTDLFQQYACAAAEEAVRQSGIETFDAARTGIVMGTALAGITLTGQTQAELAVRGKHVGPKFLTRVMGNIAAAQFAIRWGIRGPSLTVSTACSSGGDAVLLAATLLEAGMADTMVVLAGESAVSPLLVYSLSVGGALSREGACRPFDAHRDGFVIGEGGGAVILETEAHARARGAHIFAALLGWANNTDAFNPVAPDPEGAGAAECMCLALRKAGLAPEAIGYVNAHGTATVKGDLAEAKALRAVFGGARVPVGSTKGATGHMMGAGGITETIACILAIERGVLPPTVGCADPDPACGVAVVTGPTERRADAAMSNALGFGGQNSSIIVGKYQG